MFRTKFLQFFLSQHFSLTAAYSIMDLISLRIQQNVGTLIMKWSACILHLIYTDDLFGTSLQRRIILRIVLCVAYIIKQVLHRLQSFIIDSSRILFNNFDISISAFSCNIDSSINYWTMVRFIWSVDLDYIIKPFPSTTTFTIDSSPVIVQQWIYHRIQLLHRFTNPDLNFSIYLLCIYLTKSTEKI